MKTNRWIWRAVAAGGLFWFACLARAVTAGPDRALVLPDTHFTLSGGDTAGGTAAWTQVSSPATALLQNPASPVTAGIARTLGNCVFALTVTPAGGGAPVSDQASIVLPADPWTPTTSSKPSEFALHEPRPVWPDGHTLLPYGTMIEVSLPLATALADYFGHGFQIGLNPGYPVRNATEEAQSGYTGDVIRTVRASNGAVAYVFGTLARKPLHPAEAPRNPIPIAFPLLHISPHEDLAWHRRNHSRVGPREAKPQSPHEIGTTLRLAGGKTFVVSAPAASPENKYISAATLNGKPWNQAWLRHADLIDGGELTLVMGPKPADWGARNPPPSLSPTR